MHDSTDVPRVSEGHEYDPDFHAHCLGIQVLTRPLHASWGLWLPDHATIILGEGMTFARRRYTLTHEIGHALYGHRGTSDDNELEADRFAWSRIADPFEAIAKASRDATRKFFIRDRFMVDFEDWLVSPRVVVS
ncbi:ImmA/IrrE family metallo-endopeptidase [Gryllotalpicola reticulitermitis]|uniref:ImmA/IrrE family metallo-endopeptidase n=1 Tax=Gryllotalpicola reticulitermitis TaxID=1184153 RepID=A0ABV8QC35_9MICO